MVAGVQMSDAQATFISYFKTHKTYRQFSNGTPAYQSGRVELFLGDGAYAVTRGCLLNGETFQFPAISDPFNCNIGATGIVLNPRGPDTNNDGVPDPQFWEVLSVVTANFVEAGRPDKVQLQGKPVSDFPLRQGQTLPGIEDTALTIFYNLQTRTQSELYLDPYELAGYSWTRNYPTLKQMDAEIKVGERYEFRFPRVNFPDVVVGQAYGIIPAPEGYVTKPVKGGFRFLSVPKYDGNSFAEYDYRVVNFLKWEGLISNALIGTEQLYLSFKKATGDGAAPAGSIIFPPPGFDDDGNTGIERYLRLPQGIAQTSYDIPPGIFAEGTKVIAELVFLRPEFMGAGNQQPARRVFELPMIFANTLTGFLAASFPTGTPAASRTKYADPDGDGIPNWIEWLSGTDPAKANAPKNLSTLSFVPPSSARSGEPTNGFWQMTLDRPMGLPDGAVDVQSSSDLKTWATISNTDPDWKKEDNKEVPYIRIISQNPELVGKRYFRVKYNF